jgi:hypothetical protein
VDEDVEGVDTRDFLLRPERSLPVKVFVSLGFLSGKTFILRYLFLLKNFIRPVTLLVSFRMVHSLNLGARIP